MDSQSGFVRRFGAALPLAALIALTLGGAPWVQAATVFKYAGYYSNVSWAGVDGYLRQSTTTPLSGTQAHVVYINVCGASCATRWAQIGTTQGYEPVGTTYGQVHMYWENKSECGEHFVDLGPPPQPDYPYYVNWDGGGTQTETCDDGSQKHEYVFLFRIGSFNSTPIHSGYLTVTFGQGAAVTETQDGALIGTDRFGCDPNLGCSNASYGIHTYGGSSWSSLTNATQYPASYGSPPYVHQWEPYWSFSTCPVSC